MTNEHYTNGILAQTQVSLAFIKSEIKVLRRGQNVLFYLTIGLALLVLLT